VQPLVSILIPAYNAELWIADTIQSAANQTWPRKEIIVVDDGSSDRTLEIAREFSAENISVVSQPNSGAAAARNKAYSLSKGDYIQWLDADDLLAPDKVQKQMQAALEGGSRRKLLSSEWGHFIYRPHKANFLPTGLWRDLSPVEWLLCKMEEGSFMQTATWLVSRELSETGGPWDPRLFYDDDGEYFCRIILASNVICFVAEAKVFYRRVATGERVSHVGLSKTKIEALFLSVQLHIQHLRTLEDGPRVRAACLKYLDRYALYFYPEQPHIFERARQLANDLGGELEIPRLSPKYAWIRPLFGWTAAKRTQLLYNHCKSFLMSGWDHALLRLNF
jgi:glycosyltransferase involved in cell wall biosynthesis